MAGSDSGGGAGIQADLKVFTALGVYGMSAITAVTSQNTLGITRIDPLSAEAVACQMKACLDDIGADAAKTGMLQSAAIVEAVADVFQSYQMTNLVVDPVMVAKSGASLMERDACNKLKERLLPLARITTPNLSEATVLSGIQVRDLDTMKEAAKRIADLGPRVVVVKGGHLRGDPVDLVFDGWGFHSLMGERILTRNTHGTGCTFSAAITAGLAQGLGIMEAVGKAKRLINWAIAHSLHIGAGHGPTNHFFCRT